MFKKFHLFMVQFDKILGIDFPRTTAPISFYHVYLPFSVSNDFFPDFLYKPSKKCWKTDIGKIDRPVIS